MRLTGHSMRLAGHSMRLASHSMRLASHSMRLAGHSMRLAGHSMRLAGHSMRLAGMRLAGMRLAGMRLAGRVWDWPVWCLILRDLILHAMYEYLPLQIEHELPSQRTKGTAYSPWVFVCLFQLAPEIGLFPQRPQCLVIAPLLVLLVTADITEDDTAEPASESFSFFFLSLFLRGTANSSFLISSLAPICTLFYSSFAAGAACSLMISTDAISQPSNLSVCRDAGNGPKPCLVKNPWGFGSFDYPTMINAVLREAFSANCCRRHSFMWPMKVAAIPCL